MLVSQQEFLSLYKEQRQHAQIGSHSKIVPPLVTNIIHSKKKKKNISNFLIIVFFISSTPFLLWRTQFQRSLQSSTNRASQATVITETEVNLHGCAYGVAVGADLVEGGTRGLLALMNSIISNYQPIDDTRINGQDNNNDTGNEEKRDQDEQGNGSNHKNNDNLCIFVFSNPNDINERKQSVDCAFGNANLHKIKIIHQTLDRRNWIPTIYNQEEENNQGMEYRWFRYYLTPNDVDGLDKVLYLDTDIVIQGNIAELFHWDMNDHVVAAAKYWEPFRNHLCQNHKLSDIKIKSDEIGLFGQTKTITPFDVPNHINTGLLLINLDKMSSQRILDKWSSLLHLHNEECLWIEDYTGEAAFTLAIQGDAQKLPDEWSVGNLGKPEKFRLFGGCEKAKALHWNGNAKPYTSAGRTRAFCSEFFDKYEMILQPNCHVNQF